MKDWKEIKLKFKPADDILPWMRDDEVFDVSNILCYPLFDKIRIVCRVVIVQQYNIPVIVMLRDIRQNTLIKKLGVSFFGQAIDNKKLSQTMETETKY